MNATNTAIQKSREVTLYDILGDDTDFWGDKTQDIIHSLIKDI